MSDALPAYVINTDGGSRGNPGPAACGFVVRDNIGNIIHEHGRFLGDTTNNMAEYYGVIDALEWLKAKRIELQSAVQIYPVTFLLDSQLVVNQIIGRYRVKESRFVPLLEQIKQLIVESGVSATFLSVPRGQNKDADRMVNQTLDTVLC